VPPALSSFHIYRIGASIQRVIRSIWHTIRFICETLDVLTKMQQ